MHGTGREGREREGKGGRGGEAKRGKGERETAKGRGYGRPVETSLAVILTLVLTFLFL